MTPFQLKIVTPYGAVFDGAAEELIVRTTSGDLGILAGHINIVAPLGMGQAVVVVDGQRKTAACIGGMVTVVNGVTTLVPTTFEWAEDIDFKRAAASEQRAKAVIANKDTSKTDLRLAEARLKRALVRKNVASRK